MNGAVAFWNILYKDIRTYYLKPPNISWGLIFPAAWTLMFFVRSGQPPDVRDILPGVIALSILFGTTSMLAVTITFERMQKSFDRLLLAPISLTLLLAAKTTGAIIFGCVNAFVPVAMALFLTDLGGVRWAMLPGAVLLIAVTSTFLGLFIAVSVSQVFEAQTFSNFFRFPMVFLCGLFIPVAQLPLVVRPLSYALPLTYGADILHAAINGDGRLPPWLSFAVLLGFSLMLFAVSRHNVRRRWIP